TVPGVTVTPPQPRSLHESVDPGGLSTNDLGLEIKLIEQWLGAHPERTQQSDHLRSELKRLQRTQDARKGPFNLRFWDAWYQARQASLKEVLKRDKAFHDSSITRGLIKVDELVPSPEAVWQYGVAGGLFAPEEKKDVQEWAENQVEKSFDKRYDAAKYGRLYDDERRYREANQYPDEPRHIWRRGEEYNLFFPGEKARVLGV